MARLGPMVEDPESQQMKFHGPVDVSAWHRARKVGDCSRTSAPRDVITQICN